MLDQFFFTHGNGYLCLAIYDTKETDELSIVLYILTIYAFLSADFIHHPSLNSNPFLNFPQDYAVIKNGLLRSILGIIYDTAQILR